MTRPSLGLFWNTTPGRSARAFVFFLSLGRQFASPQRNFKLVFHEPCFVEGDNGVFAETRQFFFSVLAILQPPELRPGRWDEEEEPVSVVKFVSLVGWLWRSNLRVCKHRIPPRLAQDTPHGVRYPKLIPPGRIVVKRKSVKNTYKERG